MVTAKQYRDRPVGSYDQLITKFRDQLTDVEQQRSHILKGTLDQYYHDTIQQVITDVTLLPLVRTQLESETYHDQETDRDALHTAVLAIITLFSETFGKSRSEVEMDFQVYMKNYPVDDVREAARLRADNRLH